MRRTVVPGDPDVVSIDTRRLWAGGVATACVAALAAWVGVEAFFAGVDAEADALAVRLRRECLALEEPRLADTFDWVYATKSPELVEQLARHQEYTASFEEAR